MGETQRPRPTLWQIVEDDQTTVSSCIFSVVCLAVLVYEWLSAGDSDLGMQVLFGAMGSVSMVLFIRRISLAIKLHKYGLLIGGRIKHIRSTARGHCEIKYQFSVEGKKVFGAREVVRSFDFGNRDIWVLVSPENSEKHFVILPKQEEGPFC